MKIEYNKLFEKLKEEKITQKEFKEKANINSATLANLRNNKSVTTDTICKICDYFHCMPYDIMEWYSDSDYEQKKEEKAYLEAQIAELQAKLKQI